MRVATSPARALVPLFLVSLAAVGYETALTRYFAVAKWSEYGYWVISIVMVGFALSGVILALFRDAFARHGTTLLAALPALLVATAALGFHFTTTNPFNPLQLQNPATWTAQVWNIAGYYACLLPFFFLAGVFVSLSFVLNADRIGQVYGYDLTGAGAGAALVLAAMFVVHAFFLVPLLLVPLAASACFVAGRRRWAGTAAAAVALLGAEALLLLDNRAEFNDFKAIYAPLHTPDAACARHRAVTTRRLRAAGRLHRTCRHRHLQQCRHARRARPAADLRAVSRRQPHCRTAEAGRLRCGLCRRIARRTAISADPACERAAGRRLGRLPDRGDPGARRGAYPRAGAGAGPAARAGARSRPIARVGERWPRQSVGRRTRGGGS